MDTPSSQLVRALLEPDCYDHPVVDRVTLVETHISWVLLTGRYAYKIKKPVNLGFLDFGDLGSRHFYCQEELRLNRRLAPDLYLDVVSISGTPDAPRVNGPGPAIEYAVKMRQFRQEEQFDHLLTAGRLDEARIRALAGRIAEFHDGVAVAGNETNYGDPDTVYAPMRQNFTQIAARCPQRGEAIEPLERWTEDQFRQLSPQLRRRKVEGRIRECHGDLHLRNITLWKDEIAIFDCIEFDPALRWIDVMSDLGFLVMDLQERGEHALASACVDAYLQTGGDYSGLRVLRFYQAYRAMVRAKVACIRVAQNGLSDAERDEASDELSGYVATARRYCTTPAPALLITHGVSGSGKSTVARRLVQTINAVSVRSDIERKRLFEMAPLSRTGSGADAGIYAPEATERTYARLAELAGHIIDAGFSAIVDAAFLRRDQRDRFRRLAADTGVPFILIDVRADTRALRDRVARRTAEGADPSDATLNILEHQLRNYRALDGDESADTVILDTTHGLDLAPVHARLTGH